MTKLGSRIMSVTCSCGETTTISMHIKKYVPENREWKWSDDPIGWYCGKEEHHPILHKTRTFECRPMDIDERGLDG